MDLNEQIYSILNGTAATAVVESLLEKKDEPKHVASIILLRKTKKAIETFIGRHPGGFKDGKEWLFAGGHVDDGETPEEAACREMGEETNIKRKPDELTKLTVRKSPEAGRDVHDHIFYVEVHEDEKAESGSDLKDGYWVSLEDLPKLAFKSNQYVYRAASKLFGPKADVAEAKADASDLTTMADKMFVDGGKGLLIVFEGIDGAGKSTQVDALINWLEDQGHEVVTTKWASSDLLKDTIRKAKDERILTPTMYSLIHASDLVARYETVIEPALKRNAIVLSDRYVYTSLVRDKLRGADPGIIEAAYHDMRRPDIIFHCDVADEIAFSRLMKGKGLTYYGSGMDIGYSRSKEESAMHYQHEAAKLYHKLLPTQENYVHVDTTDDPDTISKRIRQKLADKFKLDLYEAGSASFEAKIRQTLDKIAEQQNQAGGHRVASSDAIWNDLNSALTKHGFHYLERAHDREAHTVWRSTKFANVVFSTSDEHFISIGGYHVVPDQPLHELPFEVRDPSAFREMYRSYPERYVVVATQSPRGAVSSTFHWWVNTDQESWK